MLVGYSSPFGSVTRTRCLLVLSELGESYAREMSRIIECPLNSVQGALRRLERDGLVVARTVGRNRMYMIDPRYFAKQELGAYLKRLLEGDPGLAKSLATLRRRPRRTDKRL